MTIFTRAINAEINQHRKVIGTAYRAAGKEMVNTAGHIRDLIVTADNVNETANRLAREAYDATDPEKFYAEAIQEINEARAAETLKEAFLRNANAVAQQKINTLIDTAVKDLTPTFNREVKALTTAANQLDHTLPLDPETAITLDAGTALTTARHSLKQLSVYASIHGHYPHTLEQRALREALVILDIPEPTIEQVYRTPGAVSQTANESDLETTRMLRTLHENLKRDTDSTLIGIARGDYAGVTISLATVAEHRERLEKARNAFQRKTIEPNTRGVAFI